MFPAHPGAGAWIISLDAGWLRGETSGGRMTTASRWPLVGRTKELQRLATMLATARYGGVVIAGPAGVGKTRLAEECLVLAERHGFATARALGSESAATIPLGALSPLLPAFAGERAPAELLRKARAAIARRGPDGHLALLVDDAHRLDEMSATLVGQMASEGEAFVIATLRSEVPAPDAIVALWKDEVADRIDLRPLDASAVEELLRSVLGDDVEGGTVHRFTEASGGNPLFLRELILAARESDLLGTKEGLWRLSGPLPVSSRLVEIVAARVGMLQDREREALELVVYGEPLGVAFLEDRFDADLLNLLERLELVTVVRDGRRLQAMLAHPLYGEVIRSRVPIGRARFINRALAAALASHGVRRREDLLRLGTCQLEGGGTGDPTVLLAAAQAARNRWDLALAERLAQAAVRSGAGFDAQLLVGQLQLLLGQARDADRSLRSLNERVNSDAERAALVMTRIDNLAFGLGQHAEALRVAEETEALLDDVEARDEIAGKRAELFYVAGKTEAALDVLQPILRRARGRTVAQVAPVAAMCLTLMGRLTEALEVAQRGHEAYVTGAGRQLTFGAHTPVVVRGVALGHAGRLHEAEAMARAGYEQALAEGSLEARAMFSELGSWVSLLRGRPATAQRYGAEAAMLHRQLGWGQFLRFALANLAHALAVMGAAEEATRVMGELDSLEIPATDVSGSLVLQARAWVRLAAGDVDGSRALLEQAAAVGRSTGDRVGEAAALHDLARAGGASTASTVSDRLTELATTVEGDLVRARAAHAVALAADDGAGLAQASSAFAALGANLFAAEAIASSAVALRRSGDGRKAAAAEVRLGAILRECEGAVTPALVAVGPQAELTRQELRVAGLAAAGLANKEIAVRLGVSVRTVETQLQRVYDKLGIHRRADLPDALTL